MAFNSSGLKKFSHTVISHFRVIKENKTPIPSYEGREEKIMAKARRIMCDENCGSMQLFLRGCGLLVLKAAAVAPAIYIFL